MWYWWVLGVVCGLIILNFPYQHWKRNIWFFRDPKRISPDLPDLLVSPCDGRVIYVKQIENGEVFSEKLGTKIDITEISKTPDAPKQGLLIGIYMSPFDVHFNYAPSMGTVTNIVHTQAKINLPMVDLWEYIQFAWLQRAVNLLGHKYHLVNERNTIFIEGPCKYALVEIADKVVNKIDCFIKKDDSLTQGQKLSFIKRGSQVDVILWGTNYQVMTKVGDHVTGAVTPLVRIEK